MRVFGIVILIINVLLLIASLLFNVHDDSQSDGVAKMSANTALLLAAIYFVMIVLSTVFLILNRLKENRLLAWLNLSAGLYALASLVVVLLFYYQG